MKKLAALLFFSITAVLLLPHVVSADSGASLVIEEAQAGTTNYRHEFIALRNRMAETINLNTYNVAVTDAQGVAVTDIPLTGDIVPYGVLHLVSEPYIATLESEGALSTLDYMSFEVANSNALASGGGHIALHQAEVEVDRLGYGDAVHPEGASAPALRSETSLRRCTDVQGMSVDTNDNSADFYVHDAPFDGLPGEVCAQFLEPPKPPCNGIILSEILPNPVGADTGNEFIEIYNPTDAEVQFEGCSLVVGGKTYDLPVDGVLEAKEYKAFYDSETRLTLPNSAGGSVTLITADIEETVEYAPGLKDDISWALIEEKWQETNKPTPDAVNKAFEQPDTAGGKGGGFAPCPEGKYRHPETNRCRNNETAKTLTPCKEGQERNPETNRCRSIATNARQLTPCKEGQERNPETNRCRSTATAASTLKPCAADQVRNPETNRCKKIASAKKELVPCKEGQERNPETNRCRKVRETAEAAFAVDETPPQSSAQYGWWAAGIAATGAVGYGAYEWRREIARGFMRLSVLGRTIRQSKIRRYSVY